MRKKMIIYGLVGVVATMIVIQAIPYGRNHANPPARMEPVWDSLETRALVARACYDCHSNETRWPWYSNVAPISWLIQRDVDNGREKLNFSEWDRPQREAHESAEKVREGEMPPRLYVALHLEAALSSSELQALIRGLESTFGGKQRTGK